MKRHLMPRLLLVTALTTGAVLTACAQKPYWQDPDVVRVNGESRRTETVFYGNRADALNKAFEQSENYLSLNGTWNFRYFDSYRQMPDAIEKTPAAEAAAWGTIRVPGNWEVQGHGTAIYVNHPYEFATFNPQPPKLPENTPTGVYHRTFGLPDSWAGRAVYLNVAGAKSGVYVYVNGQEVGYAEDSKDLVRYDITPYVHAGENDVVLKIWRWSTGSYLECQDFWRISGIERDVYLSSEKRANDFDFEVVSTLDDSLQEGLFTLRVKSSAPDAQFSYELLDADGKAVLKQGPAALTGSDTFTGTVPAVRKWSSEHPELYTLLMCLDGEYTRFNVGFRRFEITDHPAKDKRGRHYRVLLVNGEPIKFKGVNLHEHNPATGHYMTREVMLRDLELMREANINAIRTCHYPQPRFFYELCDSLGFYVYSEANIESHGMGYDLSRSLGNNRAWYTEHIERVMNMYMRTRNYPCVAILSLGNEAGNGYNFYRAYEELERHEKQGMHRPVCYERAEMEWNTDMIVPQYPGADWFRRMGEMGSDRPVCPSEYAHAMGNSTGSLDLQWQHINTYPNLQGGFIWDWVDQGLDAVDEKGRAYWTYGGDYGENTPSDNNFLCNGLVNPDRTPHPALVEVKHAHRNIAIESEHPASGRFEVVNRFYFTDLKDYEVRWTLLADGTGVRKGAVRFSTAPQQREAFALTLPRMDADKEYLLNFDVVRLTADPLQPAGAVVATEQFAIQDAKRTPYVAPKGSCKIEQDDNRVVISSPQVEFVFDKQQGVVTSYKIRGREIFHDGFGLRPNFWRGPTDNDYGNRMPLRAQAWKQASKHFNVEVDAHSHDDAAVIHARYKLSDNHSYAVDYAVYASGVVAVHAAFYGDPGEEKPVDIPRIGLRMRMPASADAFTYYGRGPEENYCDRFTGTRIGRYTSSAEAEFYPYVRPQECGHHIDCRDLTLGGVTFVADGTFEFNALRVSVEDLDSEESSHDYQWENKRPNESHDPEKARNTMRRQQHVNDIETRDFVELCLDARQTGVGGYDSWGSRPEKSRTVWSNANCTFGFAIVPQEVMPAAKARKYTIR